MSSKNSERTLTVAMQLTELYCKEYIVEDVEELQELFSRFYATVEYCQDKTVEELEVFVPNVVKKKV